MQSDVHRLYFSEDLGREPGLAEIAPPGTVSRPINVIAIVTQGQHHRPGGSAPQVISLIKLSAPLMASIVKQFSGQFCPSSRPQGIQKPCQLTLGEPQSQNVGPQVNGGRRPSWCPSQGVLSIRNPLHGWYGLWCRLALRLALGGGIAMGGAGAAIAQAAAPSAPSDLCPIPALERVQTHRATSGETVESIARQYGLLPTAVRLMNPTLSGNVLSPGQTVRIPPFNGIEVAVPAGSTWQTLASTYQARADVLFEINGCPTTVPQRIFVPGVNGLPGVAAAPPIMAEDTDPLGGYPLAEATDLLVSFGWQPHPEEDRLVFNSGIVLAAAANEAVLAVGSGTVAYADRHETLGLLVVINHEQGLQTRYANLSSLQVAAGDLVELGDEIATVLGDPMGEMPSSLYFEVRSNSDLGWVARNPGDYIPALAVR